MPAPVLSPYHRYCELLTSGQLNPDVGQHDAVQALDALYHTLQEAGRLTPQAKGLRERVRGLFSPAPSTPAGLYLWGGVGRGKTLLMDLFHNCLGKGVSQRFHFHDFMVIAHHLINEARKTGAKDAVELAAEQLISKGSVLCFDEMEVRDIADAMILKRLFEALWERQMVLVATSNRQPEKLYLNGLHRDRFLPFIDNLNAHNAVHEIASGMDWRQRLLDGISTWHLNDDAATAQRLDDIFSQLTAAVEPHPEQIEIAGRQINFQITAGDIADTDFHQLCAIPLAAADYLAVSDRFAGLILRNVPLLDDMLQNEARRFMWLVDALYDRGRFLIAGADAPIEQLYTGQQWAFEFDRTASRLKQMAQIKRQNRDNYPIQDKNTP